MGKRRTPSFSRGAISASAVLARSPPVRLSAIMPTWWPSSACPLARSRMWRKIPPTGARTAWTMRRGRSRVSDMLLEPAFADEDGVAGAKLGAERYDEAAGAGGVAMGEGDGIAPGARREAAGNRNRAFHAHIG